MEPKILVFSCNWDGWSAVEAATEAGLHYPASVKIVRVSCLSRLHAGLILKAFEFRADGVILVGCEPGSCHFFSESGCIDREYEKTRLLLEMLGINKERLALVQLPAYDGKRFVEEIEKLSGNIARMTSRRKKKAAAVAE
jgi:coenzyme F420-reducing hydrogenase delta subunit